MGRALRIAIVLGVLAAPAAAFAADSPSRVYAPSCTRLVFKPRTINVSCDGTDVLTHLTWSVWSARSAQGAGTDVHRSCKPDCAASKPRKFAVKVTLSKPRKCRHLRRRMFTQVQIDGPHQNAQLAFSCPSIGGRFY